MHHDHAHNGDLRGVPTEEALSTQRALPVPGKVPYGSKPSPFDVFSSLNAMWIHQEAQYLENCGCEFENEYTIYGAKVEEGELKRDKKNLLFQCKEKSSCCQRHCCASSMRAFEMSVCFNDVQIDPNTHQYVSKWTPFLHMQRDYACTCCCCNRPYIRVNRVESGREEKIGTVTDAWTLCGYVYELVSLDQLESYSVRGSCCQCGLLCRCPCGPCEKVDFPIFDDKNDAAVGCISKVWPGFCRAVLTDADSYCVTFPAEMSCSFKVLVLAAALFIDFRHFEESPADKSQGHNAVTR